MSPAASAMHNFIGNTLLLITNALAPTLPTFAAESRLIAPGAEVSFVQTKISPRQVPVYFAAQMHVNREPSRWIRYLERTLSLISLFSY